MPLARVIRHSPLYLYLKLYTLSLLVTVFASSPVTRRLNRDQLQRIEHIRRVAEDTFRRRTSVGSDAHSALAHRQTAAAFVTSSGQGSSRAAAASAAEYTHGGHSPFNHDPTVVVAESKRNKSARQPTLAFPYALKTMALDADAKFPALPLRNAYQRTARVIKRWWRRLRDLSSVKGAVDVDQRDAKRFPELLMEAQVRHSFKSHPSEVDFIHARSRHIVESKVFAELMQAGLHCRSNTSTVDVEDVPTVAIGGSGGGHRAMFGFMASLQALQSKGWLDATHWLAGVSGSCWTIASLYTIGHFNVGKLIRHCKSVAQEGIHPMSRQALDAVARSSKGVYFLLAPLLSKVQSGVVGIGVMDMYATLTTCYQLLSRSVHARPRLSRSMFQFSKMWDRMKLSEGRAPLPIFTAVRVQHRDGKTGVVGKKKRQGDAEEKVKQPHLQPCASTQLNREQEALQARRAPVSNKEGATSYEWWEMNPLEVGSSDCGAWIPTWSYGRSFVCGRSVSTAPEISLALLLGQATSAPAGPLTAYISTLLATLPKGTIMSSLLSRVNTFVQLKRWEKRWGNPIRGADEPNPLYGFGASDKYEWEGKGRIKLMDSGLSNNLPNHIFTCSARRADIIVSFDQSSDVQTGAGLSRLNDFAMDRDLILAPAHDTLQAAPFTSHPEEKRATEKRRGAGSSAEIQEKFKGKYAQVFSGWYRSDLVEEEKVETRAGMHLQDDSHPLPPRHSLPHFHIIYCPLLPHHSQPEYDPVTAPFSTSYNLVWSPDEIDIIARTATDNATDYVIPMLKQVYLTVYESKRHKRRQGKEMHAVGFPKRQGIM